jgi:hypothetical protein
MLLRRPQIQTCLLRPEEYRVVPRQIKAIPHCSLYPLIETNEDIKWVCSLNQV